jgi:hypothetical protein
MHEVAAINRERRRSSDWSLKAWVSVIVLGVGTALILAVLLVIASRLASIEAALKAHGSSEELARTRYEAEQTELHRIEVALNTVAAWYQEDVRRQDDARLTGKR